LWIDSSRRRNIPIPLGGFGVILFNATAEEIQCGERLLGVLIVFFGSDAVVLCGLFGILRDPLSLVI